MYLVDLEESIQAQNYNKEVTPGNDDEIMKLIGNLRDNIEDEQIDQEWLQDNAADLEKSLQELMADQEWMDDDLATTKKMIQEQLESQKAYIKSLKQRASEQETSVEEQVVIIDQSYIEFLQSMFTLLLITALLFSMVTGGVCAYCCNRRFCRNASKNGANAPMREAHTIDMQVVK